MKAAVLCFLPMAVAVALPTFTGNDNCVRKCGNMSVPFPFGLEERCAWNSDLVLICNHTAEIGNLFLGENIPVYDISVENGTMTAGMYKALDCYDERGIRRTGSKPRQTIRVGEGGHYTLSDTRNKLTVLGCVTLAIISDANGTFGSGCFSHCPNDDIDFTAERACSGLGCCQTSIPKSLRSLNISMSSTPNYTSVDFSYCGSAFIVDEESFNISDYKLPVPDDLGESVFSRIALDWVIERGLTCAEEAKSNGTSFQCGANSFCSNFKNGDGYRCFCKYGYTGNPYGSPGCQDIDECKDPRQYPCRGKCKNTAGNYTCKCPFGMTGDGKSDCQISRLTIIAAGVGSGVGGIILLLLFWRLSEFLKRRREANIKQKFFKRNGGFLVQQHLSSIENNHMEKGKLFTLVELDTATDHFNENRILGQGGQGTVYKGMLLDGMIVAVKKSKVVDAGQAEQFVNEVAILSKINHRNVVKLLGVCLESEIPLLVYEFVPNGTLYQYLHDPEREFLVSWEMRLRIASEVAAALSYLHFAADMPVYHRDIKSSNILLDEKYRAKVADFGTSRSITIDQTHLTTMVRGAFGYFDPEYYQTSHFTDKSDVYSFGVVLVELLTGEKPISQLRAEEGRNLSMHFVISMEENRLFDVLDKEVLEHGENEEIIVVSNLAKRCLSPNGRYRPTMKEVAMELERVRSLRTPMVARQNDEETARIRTGSVCDAVSPLMRSEADVGLTSWLYDLPR